MDAYERSVQLPEKRLIYRKTENLVALVKIPPSAQNLPITY
jgi:hypothetical protein